MQGMAPGVGESVVVGAGVLSAILSAISKMGFRLVGPTVRDGAIVYDQILSSDDLPVGWSDHQEKATYRLTRSGGIAYFDYTVPQDSWKKFLHLARVRLFEAQRQEGSIAFTPKATGGVEKTAFIGVRACELAAIHVQDRVLLDGPYVDAGYKARRESLFILGVNCGKAGGTCFCDSMKTGPEAGPGYDLALTEIIDEQRHDLVIKVGTVQGSAILAQVELRPAEEADLQRVADTMSKTVSEMGRRLDTTRLPETFLGLRESPHWDKVAARCLCCTNCTLVCPTCFCTTVADSADLCGDCAVRDRRWDSCFTREFTYTHGGVVRESPRSRYRHWITHKLATWVDQFGSLGCVGCGRCITWCPAQIDITEEASALAIEAAGARPVYAEGV